MTMQNPGQTNPNTQIQLSPKETSLVVELFSEKVRGIKSSVVTAGELAAKLTSCYALVHRHREIAQRIEEYKKVLGVKELSKETILTAINNGQFPATKENFDESESYYLRHFAGGGETKKPKAPRKPKAKPAENNNTSAANPS